MLEAYGRKWLETKVPVLPAVGAYVAADAAMTSEINVLVRCIDLFRSRRTTWPNRSSEG